ncbi:MAG: UDP-N-acetylmuramate--L-alanine ligase [Acidobacteria bacterium]|nr:UDP-N-acetylmuramate--L-alanine ligase [Acidobacteriota bacterium]
MYKRRQNIHFVGIGGIGMSGIAELLINLGYEVSGSDLRASPITRRLEQLGGTIYIGHQAEQVAGAHVVVTSSAVSSDNAEVTEAVQRGIPVIPRAEMLAELMRMKHSIAVAGSHGKTTTTSILGTVLEGADLDPTVVIGGRLQAWGTNARLGHGDFLVAEADESDGSFLRLSPTFAIVTNIDREHLDHYRDFDELQRSFVTFLNSVPFYGASIVCLDDPNIQEVIPRIKRKLITYGFSSQADIRAADVVVQPDGTSFACYMDGELAGKVRLRLHGRHNALNTLAAIAVARELDIDFATIARTLAVFAGTDRRMQQIGAVNDILVIDDYGHHPTEIRAVLSTVRDAWDRRTIVCFQPHRYSRSQLLMEDFGRAFYQADSVFVLPIYAAGEEPIPGVTSEALATSIVEHGHKAVHGVENLEQATEALTDMVRAGDLVLTLGAGDVWKVARDLVERLRHGTVDADPNAGESAASVSGKGA